MSHLSGFPELNPGQQQLFDTWCHKLDLHCRTWGFYALQTPAVERLNTLLAKGDDHEIYGLYRLGSPEASMGELGLRFDLTIPMARHVAHHCGQLTFPYRRFQIAPVWRGERPQAGRYRQFHQCDVDVVGQKHLDKRYTSEVLAVLHHALNFLQVPQRLGSLVWQINHRGILAAWCRWAGISDTTAALRWIDKKQKIPSSLLHAELVALGAGEAALQVLYTWMAPTASSSGNQDPSSSPNDPTDERSKPQDPAESLTSVATSEQDNLGIFGSHCMEFYSQTHLTSLTDSQHDPEKTRHTTTDTPEACYTMLERLRQHPTLCADSTFAQAVDDLTQMVALLPALGVPLSSVQICPWLARGLTYYSGIVFEAILPQHLALGSICAGGQYDHLAQQWSGKTPLPGVGGSLGLSRLFGAYIQHPDTSVSLCAGDILVALQQPTGGDEFCAHLAGTLRAAGWRVETYWQPASLGAQIKYACAKGFIWVVFANADEQQSGIVQVKHLATGQQHTLPVTQLTSFLQSFTPQDIQSFS